MRLRLSQGPHRWLPNPLLSPCCHQEDWPLWKRPTAYLHLLPFRIDNNRARHCGSCRWIVLKRGMFVVCVACSPSNPHFSWENQRKWQRAFLFPVLQIPATLSIWSSCKPWAAGLTLGEFSWAWALLEEPWCGPVMCLYNTTIRHLYEHSYALTLLVLDGICSCNPFFPDSQVK